MNIENYRKQQFIECADHLVKTCNTLSKYWGKLHNDDFATENYPFQKDFDELRMDIQHWAWSLRQKALGPMLMHPQSGYVQSKAEWTAEFRQEAWNPKDFNTLIEVKRVHGKWVEVEPAAPRERE